MAAAASFFLTLGRFKANLTERERTDFQSTTLNDLHVAIQGIQDRQALERRLQGMQRLERFLEAMKEYDKVIRIFVNSSEILAFVWVSRIPLGYTFFSRARLISAGPHEISIAGTRRSIQF
jgi:PAS domain-containing protein